MSEQVEIPDIDDLPDITENTEFSPVVKLLTTETPVLGYDGDNINPANWQAQALANRTQWLRDRLLNLSTRLVLSVNGNTGNVVVTYADIGADAAGAADALMTAHLTALDPHSQYFNEIRGDVRYVRNSQANQSNGWLQLDTSGKIPAAMLQTLASRYVVVANQTARLALASSANLTICAQADIDQLFYLNGGANPSVAANWVAGQSATVSGVPSVYGRTGAVVAQAGDYDADKITETATRKFATPTEKTAWNAKQSALVSGTNIRSLFGNSLLGSGNLAPTPAQMGVAASVHPHTTADITDFTQQAQLLIISSLEAGPGVTLGQNPVNGKTIISAAGGSGGGSGYIVVEHPGATAGQNHSFSFSPQSAFNLAAYALKEVSGATNQTYVIDDFAMASEVNYALTNAIIFDGMIHSYIGQTLTLNADGALYSAPIRADGEFIEISVVQKSVVPKMTSNTTPIGYIVSASEMSRPAFAPFYVFDNDNNLSTDANDCWGGLGAPSVSNPHWLRIDLSAQATIGSYNFANRTVIYTNSPRDWILQGSNDNGTTWVNLHTVTNDLNNTLGAVREYQLPAPVSYKSYRLYITATFNSNAYVTLKKFNLMPPSKLLIKGGGKWYSANNGTLTDVGTNDFSRGFLKSGKIAYAAIASLLPITIFSDAEVIVQNIYTPYPQVAVQKSLFSAAAWGQINAATLTATQTTGGFVRVAVTRDLMYWHVWRGGAWVDIGLLSADTASATKLITDGMTPSDLNGITAAGWTQLFASNSGAPDYLAFAFGLDISDPVTDVATIDRLTLNVNEASSWKVQTPTEVEIRWRADSVTFRTVTAGNYKLAYQIP